MIVANRVHHSAKVILFRDIWLIIAGIPLLGNELDGSPCVSLIFRKVKNNSVVYLNYVPCVTVKSVTSAGTIIPSV